jgi:predicted nucleic acid-binding protein
MPYLLDTGILLRLVDDKDAQHALVRSAVRELITRGENLLITTQNIAEFCNVATRPVANNGFGLQPGVAVELLQKEIEPICLLILQRDPLPAEYKRLLSQYNIVGKQTHDARLVAMMLVWQVNAILTLNERNFQRFLPEGITVISPATISAAKP